MLKVNKHRSAKNNMMSFSGIQADSPDEWLGRCLLTLTNNGQYFHNNEINMNIRNWVSNCHYDAKIIFSRASKGLER